MLDRLAKNCAVVKKSYLGEKKILIPVTIVFCTIGSCVLFVGIQCQVISSTFVVITEKEMLLPNCKPTAGHNTHQNGMYLGNSVLKNHYCQ